MDSFIVLSGIELKEFFFEPYHVFFAGPVAGCCECSDEPSGSGAMELVS
jgi:hypothetical protein